MSFPTIPDHPPPDIDFASSMDDETCPECGWDREEASMDYIKSNQQGLLIAVEQAEGSPFTSMAGTMLVAIYWRCPEGHYFVTEEELTMGAMS